MGRIVEIAGVAGTVEVAGAEIAGIEEIAGAGELIAGAV